MRKLNSSPAQNPVPTWGEHGKAVVQTATLIAVIPIAWGIGSGVYRLLSAGVENLAERSRNMSR